MELFDVYKMLPLELAYAKGYHVYDTQGREYLDFYGGHAVISIGHGHTKYIAALTKQLHDIAYYSNAVEFPLRNQLAQKLGQLSGYEDYQLFLCNSGAEAIENALKVASFYNGKKKIVAFKGGFHGRTSAAVSITDNPAIQAPVNSGGEVVILEAEEIDLLEQTMAAGNICAVVLEGIRGVGGIYVPSPEFMEAIEKLCAQHEAVFICDEIQSGYGRTGKFFAHQHAGVKPDLITVAKGMGNGFPIGGVLIHPKFKPKAGMLGTTFGGNPLACAAGMSVLEIMEKEELTRNAAKMGQYLKEQLQTIPAIREVVGEGLMLGLVFEGAVKETQQALVEEQVLTGSSSRPNEIRLLPPLTIDTHAVDSFITALKKVVPQGVPVAK